MSKPAAGDRLWQRTALLGGFAVAALALALSTRMTALYFGAGADLWGGLIPRPGPHLASAWAAHAVRVTAAALFFLSLPGLGALCLPRSRAWPPFTAAGVGLAAWALAGFGLAAAGLCPASILRPLSLILTALGLWRGRRALRDLFRPQTLEGMSPMAWACVLCGAFYLVTTLVPETFYDALVYHLAAPQAWLAAGRMTDMPDIHLWRLPGMMQPLYLWALAWSDDRLCKILNVGIALLAAGHLGRWAADRWDKKTGHWAALLFLSAPLVGVNVWSCANDVPAGFFAFLALTLWLASWKEGSVDRTSVLLAGFFFGAAAAMKSTALFAAPYFLFDALRRARAGGHRNALTALALFGAGAMAPLLPWWIRAVVWTGNPFFPQAAGLLGGDAPNNLALLDGWHVEAAGEGGLFSRCLSLVRESLRGIEAGRFGFLGPTLLMLLPLAFFFRPGPLPGALAGYAFIAYAAFTVVTGRLRYYLPHMPPLFALAALGLTDYAAGASADKLGRKLARALTALVAAATALNLVWMALVFQRFNQGWPVVWGAQSAADYLRTEHIGVYGHPSQGAFDWLKAKGAAGKVFVVGDARTFRSPLPAAASGAFNVPAYARWSGTPPDAAALTKRLRDEGFTYLLINLAEMRRITPREYAAPDHLKALGGTVDVFSPALYRDDWCMLFEVRKEAP